MRQGRADPGGVLRGVGLGKPDHRHVGIDLGQDVVEEDVRDALDPADGRDHLCRPGPEAAVDRLVVRRRQGEVGVNHRAARRGRPRVVHVGVPAGPADHGRVRPAVGRQDLAQGGRQEDTPPAESASGASVGSRASITRPGGNSGSTTVLAASPWSPGWRPVTMLAAFVRVTVGKTAWWRVKRTPSVTSAWITGVRAGDTCAGWSPSKAAIRTRSTAGIAAGSSSPWLPGRLSRPESWNRLARDRRRRSMASV